MGKENEKKIKKKKKIEAEVYGDEFEGDEEDSDEKNNSLEEEEAPPLDDESKGQLYG